LTFGDIWSQDAAMTENTPETPHPTDTTLRALLEDVAAGRLEPDAAARRLQPEAPNRPGAAAGGPAESSPWGTPPTGSPYGSGGRVLPPSAGPGEPPVQRVVVSVAAGKLVLVGDRTVSTAEAQGPVVASREGSTLRLDNRPITDAGFRFERGDREDRPWRRWRHAFPNTETITVRVNPELPVELSVAAGSAQVTGLRGGLGFRVDAGSLRVFDGAGPLEGRVASGSVQLEWLIREGAASLRAELGTLKVRLLPGSDVTVSARAEMGSAELGPEAVRGDDGRRRITVGGGRATLDIDVDLGSVKVQTP
jgi:hypothetical protein